MAGSDTDWYINSVPKGLEIYTSSGNGTWTNRGSSLKWSHHTYVRFIDSAGKNMTRYCSPIESVPFSRIAYIFQGVNNYNDVSDSWSIDGMETERSSMTVEKTLSPSIGNIPMGELTFNGVQSVTYNGTDYTKLVVDGTSYPPPPVIISFTVDSATYQAEEGMTWAEWVASSYNTGGFIISEGSPTNVNYYLIKTSSYGFLQATDAIISGEAYVVSKSEK